MSDVYVIWRMDGDFMITEIPESVRPKKTASLDEWVKVAIIEEHRFHGFDESEIHEALSQATDPDNTRYCGYEILTIFETEKPISYIY